MSRYFFDLAGEFDSLDEEGVELQDLDSARVEAIRLLGELLRDDAERLSACRSCQVVVRGQGGQALAFVQTVIGVYSAPPAAPVRQVESA